jgi:3-isopropylmalate/(R)-2-methylmalate dehydratase large subunit
MGQTLSQKILAMKSGNKEVSAGQIIKATVDMCLGNDITLPLAIQEVRRLRKADGSPAPVFDPQRIVMVCDHFTPNKDIKSAEQVKLIREFAREYGIEHFFDVGCMGIEHILLPQLGLVMGNDLVIGADSHTCTYGGIGAFSTGVGSTDLAAVMAEGKIWLRVPEALKFVLKGELPKYSSGKDVILYTIGKIGVDGARYMSMEFVGGGAEGLSVSDRLTVANMAIEAGAKNGIFPVDEKAREYMSATQRYEQSRFAEFSDLELRADKDAEYADVHEYDLGDIEPQVAYPHLPSKTKPISEAQEECIHIDQAVIGACTNGKIEDLRQAAEIMKGRKKHPYVRVIVIPGTQEIYEQAMREGLFEIFLNFRAAISTPTCGPCLGGHMGVLAAGERAIATTNRNFVGRMGSPDSEVYLANPAVAAASAVKGRICGPEALK